MQAIITAPGDIYVPSTASKLLCGMSSQIYGGPGGLRITDLTCVYYDVYTPNIERLITNDISTTLPDSLIELRVLNNIRESKDIFQVSPSLLNYYYREKPCEADVYLPSSVTTLHIRGLSMQQIVFGQHLRDLVLIDTNYYELTEGLERVLLVQGKLDAVTFPSTLRMLYIDSTYAHELRVPPTINTIQIAPVSNHSISIKKVVIGDREYGTTHYDCEFIIVDGKVRKIQYYVQCVCCCETEDDVFGDDDTVEYELVECGNLNRCTLTAISRLYTTSEDSE